MYNSITKTMLKNYLTIALRNLRKQKGSALVNIAGLALGFGVSGLFLLLSWTLYTFDGFHEYGDDVYLVYQHFETEAGTRRVRDTWPPTLAALQDEFPAIITGTRLYEVGQQVSLNEAAFQETVYYTDPTFFEVFSFPLLRGDPRTVLSAPDAAVLSERAARKFFGNEDPVGKTLMLDGRATITITGVAEDPPVNSSIRFDLLVNLEHGATHIDFVREQYDRWNWSFLETYVRLHEGSSPTAIEPQLPRLVAHYIGEEEAERTGLGLIRLTDVAEEWHNFRTVASVLLVLALGILLIACINFTNLATARSLDRAREIGMRKVLGAHRPVLIRQFLSESIVVALLALAIGIGLVELASPAFNRFLHPLAIRDLQLDNVGFVLVLLGFGTGVGVVAGAYPAFFLSRFDALQTLKGRLSTRPGGARLRSTLVVVQFALTIFLVASALVVHRQVDFMKGHGFDFGETPVLVVPVTANAFESPEHGRLRIETWRQELLRSSEVASVSVSSSIPGAYYTTSDIGFLERDGARRELRMRVNLVDEAFIDAYRLRIVSGRNFSSTLGTDPGNTAIINETALRVLGWDSIEGKQLYRGDTPYTVIGVVEDFHYTTLQDRIGPVVHLYMDETSTDYSYVSVRAADPNPAGVLNLLQSRWDVLGSTRAFSYFLADEHFDRNYVSVEKLAGLVTTASILGILIACIGLFGLAALTTVQRTKEIGIRKVLGASVPGLLLLLSRHFAWLVLIALVLAAPPAYVVMRGWLQHFAYRVELDPGVFLLSGVLALATALLAVGYQALRAALSDPVESLRYE